MIFANDHEGIFFVILIKFSGERRDIGIAASTYTLSFPDGIIFTPFKY